jgi:hypothetical protein
MLPLQDKVFTKELTNDSLTLTNSMGVKKISIVNDSAVDGTVLGTQKLAGVSPSAITISQDETVTIVANQASVLVDLVITAPSGCTLSIVALS